MPRVRKYIPFAFALCLANCGVHCNNLQETSPTQPQVQENSIILEKNSEASSENSIGVCTIGELQCEDTEAAEANNVVPEEPKEPLKFGLKASLDYLRRGEYDNAEAALQPDLERTDDATRELAEQMVSAYIMAGRGDHEASAQKFRSLMEENGWIRDGIAFYAAESDFNAKKFDDAIALYDLVTGERRSQHYHNAVYHKALALYELGKWQEAQKAFDQILSIYNDHPHIPDIMLKRAICLIHLDKKADASTLIDRLIFDYPWTKAGKEAVDVLEQHQLKKIEHSFDEKLDRLDFLRRKRHWVDAQVAADELDKMNHNSQKLLWQRGRLAYDQSDYATAIPILLELRETLEKLPKNAKADVLPRNVNKYLYYAYAESGDYEHAEPWFLRNNSLLSKAERTAGLIEMYKYNGKFDEAFKLVQETHTKVTKNKKTKKTQKTVTYDWEYAFTAYLAEDFTTAELAFRNIIDSASSAMKSKYYYWYGQTLKRQAKWEDARKAFNNSIKANPESFHALLSWSRLWDMDHSKAEGAGGQQAKRENVSVDGSTPTIDWTRFDEKSISFEQIDQPFLEPVPENTLALFAADFGDLFPSAQKAYFYDLMGDWTARNWEMRNVAFEFFALRNQQKSPKHLPALTKPWHISTTQDGHLVDNRADKRGIWGIKTDVLRFSYPSAKDKEATRRVAQRQRDILAKGDDIRPRLIETLAACGDYYLVRRYTALPKIPAGTPEVSAIWSRFYPHAFPELLIDATERQGISPYFLWTVMNIESGFNPDSISYADAFGLLQIIPITGYKIAEALNVEDFGPYNLIKPEVSIEFSAWYMSAILKKFHGQEMLSLAAYNGGPHQVARWLTTFGSKCEADAFAELIPFREANRYVSKGLERMLKYKRVYENSPNAVFYVSNQLNTHFLEQPNY